MYRLGVLGRLLQLLPPMRALASDRDRWRAMYEAMESRDPLPVPPPELMLRVSGDVDADKFLGIGRTLYADVKRISKQSGKDIETCGSVLDFGCGCGRVLRYLHPNGRRVVGADIDAEAINWCSQHLKNVSSLVRNEPWPPLPFSSGSFELILAISVFTHLPEDMQHAWLGELCRVMATGGVLIASVLGEADLTALVKDGAGREEFARRGFHFYMSGGTPGLPDFYQLTFHRRDYVESEWTRYFELIGFYARAVNNHQDVAVLRKSTA